MTLLASQIPILYCLMYFQSNRRSMLNQSNSFLLNALTSRGRLDALNLSKRSPSHSSTDNSKEIFENENEKPLARSTRDRHWSNSHTPSPPNSDERSWVRHQATDLRQLCLERYSDTSQPTRLYTKREKSHSTPTATANNKNYNNNVQISRECSRKQSDELRQTMSDRFMTVQELNTFLPVLMNPPHNHHNAPTTQARRYKVETLPYANLKNPVENKCGACKTDIGYEVLTQVQDFQGTNYTVIHFEDAFQFIPAGRCINENSPCGGGGNARCVQIYRAQWTLVWASSSSSSSSSSPQSGGGGGGGGGVNRMVAHEVPSHCQCINVGTPTPVESDPPLIKTLGGVGAATQDDILSTDGNKAKVSSPSN